MVNNTRLNCPSDKKRTIQILIRIIGAIFIIDI